MKKKYMLNKDGVPALTDLINRMNMKRNKLMDIVDDIEDDIEDEFKSRTRTKTISFIEFGIINTYLISCVGKNTNDVIIDSYGQLDSSNKLQFSGAFEMTGSYWFHGRFSDDTPDNEYFFQTCIYLDDRNQLITQLHITSKKLNSWDEFNVILKRLIKTAFNNSEFKGKCISVKLKSGSFRGIEVIDAGTAVNELILNDIQDRYIKHFISRVEKGGSLRYLLNGEPGTGKTETIREIIRALIPEVTFIVPEFDTSDDLMSVLEACEIFDKGVIIMDDIDLYLGSRQNGSYTRLLGQFLSFFDGVKKRKISLLASTNDKGLVDKAAERPGRFNFTLDYTFLDEEQIIKVCNIHLPEKWKIAEVYEALNTKINGKKVNITGAFIANLAENIKEMSEDDNSWSVEDTISLISESYKGFYSSQVEKNKNTIGFKIN
jgi:hypothetical protein